MVTYRELTDGQRNHLRDLPLYPWAVWTCRLFLGALAFVFTLGITGRGASLVEPGFLFLIPLAVINAVVTRLVLNQMKRVLHVQRFVDQARLGTAINRVLYRDALLGGHIRR
jgi:hypothetical protein